LILACNSEVTLVVWPKAPGKPKLKRRSGCPVSISPDIFMHCWSLLIAHDLDGPWIPGVQGVSKNGAKGLPQAFWRIVSGGHTRSHAMSKPVRDIFSAPMSISGQPKRQYYGQPLGTGGKTRIRHAEREDPSVRLG
jgi:hypothetical protein